MQVKDKYGLNSHLQLFEMDASPLQTSMYLPLRKQWFYLPCCHLQQLFEIHFFLATWLKDDILMYMIAS